MSSPSPGAVLRFLERLARHGEALPETLLLSDAPLVPPWRALFAENQALGLEPVAARLALAFPPGVFRLQSGPEGWQWTYFTEEGAQSTGTLARRRLWQPRQSDPLEKWARSQGLPIRRMTAPPRVLDYATVAQLDQRSLLLEDTPRLYRFSLEKS